jgi:hypothetical protein
MDGWAFGSSSSCASRFIPPARPPTAFVLARGTGVLPLSPPGTSGLCICCLCAHDCFLFFSCTGGLGSNFQGCLNAEPKIDIGLGSKFKVAAAMYVNVSTQ